VKNLWSRLIDATTVSIRFSTYFESHDIKIQCCTGKRSERLRKSVK
jgi:hypothetical protein